MVQMGRVFVKGEGLLMGGLLKGAVFIKEGFIKGVCVLMGGLLKGGSVC